jgi:excisionase family DNA binding protein
MGYITPISDNKQVMLGDNMTTLEQELANKFFFRVKEVSLLLNLSRTRIYELLDEGRLMSVKEGNKRLITRQSLINYATWLTNRQERYRKAQ